MKGLCVFDLDGTLVNTIGDLAASLNHGLAVNGLPTLSVEETAKLVGHSVSYMCYYATPEEVREQLWENVLLECDRYYLSHMCDTSRPYEGIQLELEKLQRAGYQLAVVTNKPHCFALRMIEQLFPAGTFAMVLGMKQELKKKPDPEPLDYCISTLGFTREETLYVGDSEVDVEFARNTGIPCIACSWGLRTERELLAAGAEVLIGAPAELAETIRRF